MPLRSKSSIFVAVLALAGSSLIASTAVDIQSSTKPVPTSAEIQNIVREFAAKETEFAKAREQYTYRQSNKIMEIDESGNPEGKYEMVEEVSFDDRDRRIEHVVRAPVTTLEKVSLSPEDEQDMRNVMPFVMTSDTLDQYSVNYLGREKLDEIGCYKFDVKPKQLTKDRKRYFEGEIWVDDRDLQIVKTYGRSTGHLHKNEDQQFPKFQTYREQIDGKYWFPTYTYADDMLNFRDSTPVRLKVVIKYDQYKKFQFKTNSTITFGDPGLSNNPSTTPPNSPTPAPGSTGSNPPH